MAERLNAHDSKSCDAGMYPRVQIPLSAPQNKDKLWLILVLLYIKYREGFEGGNHFARAKCFADNEKMFRIVCGKGGN